MKKLILLIISLAILTSPLVWYQNVWAQEETAPTPIVEETTEDQDAADELRKAFQEEARKIVDENQEGEKRAFVGTLKSVSGSTLTILAGEKEVKATVDEEETSILDADREEIEVDDLESGQKLIIMGFLDSQGILEAKRIVIIEEFQIPTNEAAFGTVTDISPEEKILTIKHPQQETIYMVEVDSQTIITTKVDDEVETIKFDDILEGDTLVAVGEPGENSEKIITATLIHIAGDEKETAVEDEEEPLEEETEEADL